MSRYWNVKVSRKSRILTISVGSDDPVTFSMLAQMLHVSPSYFSAMVHCGYRPLYGRRTTYNHFIEWKARNPGAVTTLYACKKERQNRAMESGPSGGLGRYLQA